MPRIDLLQDPLLTPPQEAVLSPMKDILREIEFPTDTTLTQTELLTSLIGTVVSTTSDAATFLKQQLKPPTRPAESAEELERRFSISALTASSLDLTFKTFGKIMASQLGVLDAVGATTSTYDPEQIDEAKERVSVLGDNLILFRARMAGTFTLQAAGLLYDVYPSIGEEVSSWQRAKDAFDRVPNVSPPVSIEDAEGELYDEIRDKAFVTQPAEKFSPPLGAIKVGRSKTLNAIRTVAKVRKLVREYGGATQEQFLALLEQTTATFIRTSVPVAELEPDEIIRGLRTVKKTVRYIGSAAILDPELARDPKVRYVAYLSEELDGYDVKSEHAVFQRDRKVAAKRERKKIKE